MRGINIFVTGRDDMKQRATRFYSLFRSIPSTTLVDITQETPKQTNITRGDCLLDVKSIPLAQTSKDF
jgi:hypothetical protein